MLALSRGVAGLLCCGLLTLTASAGEATPGMTAMESLVLKLASADLTSEPHPMPSTALAEFAVRTSSDYLVNAEKRTYSRIITVRQPEHFEFIHAESDGVMIRQLPNIMVLGFKPAAPSWRADVWKTIVGFLRENVNGRWDRLGPAKLQKFDDTVFYSNWYGFHDSIGTCFDCFLAVVVEDMVWIGFPKRAIDDGRTLFSTSPEQNTGWFEKGFREDKG